MKYTKYIIAANFLLLTFIFSGCNDCNHSAVKGIETKAQIYRFDSMFYAINNPAELNNSLKLIEEKDSLFFQIYTAKVFNLDPIDPAYESIIFNHINSTQNQAIKKEIDKQFGDFKIIKENLNLLSKYYKLYYPNRRFPEIKTCYSGFAAFMAWLYNDTAMLVDLDMYLGADFEAYPQFYPLYKFTYYDKEYLVQNIATELIRREFIPYEKEKPKHMLAMMLIEGAKLYELTKLMPCRENAKLIQYSTEQWQWAEREEKQIWQYLVKESLLYESDYKEYRPLISEAPASIRSGVAKGAPPRIGVFAGYKIVKKFMEESDVKDAYEMFSKYSPEDILKIAKYKP